MRFVQTQTLSLRTAIARLTPCASSTRKRYRLFGYKPHFRAAAGSPCRSRYRFARFGECGFYLKNTMHLLRILWNGSVSFLHKADAHVTDVRGLYYSLPLLPKGRWRCAERVSANTSRMSGV